MCLKFSYPLCHGTCTELVELRDMTCCRLTLLPASGTCPMSLNHTTRLSINPAQNAAETRQSYTLLTQHMHILTTKQLD